MFPLPKVAASRKKTSLVCIPRERELGVKRLQYQILMTRAIALYTSSEQNAQHRDKTVIKLKIIPPHLKKTTETRNLINIKLFTNPYPFSQKPK